jgi:hypothetical protein
MSAEATAFLQNAIQILVCASTFLFGWWLAGFCHKRRS